MRTRNLILALLLGANSFGYAQLRLGVKAGLNVASLKGTYAANVSGKQKIGFHGGLTAEYPFTNPKLALLGELLLSTQGSVTEQSQQTLYNGAYAYIDTETTLSLTNINLPIMLKYYVVDRLSIEGGPQFGYVVSAKNKVESTNTADPTQNQSYSFDPLKDGTYVSNGLSQNYAKSVNAFDFGFNLGAGYDFSDTMYMQLHYYFGINNVQTLTNSYAFNAPRQDYKSAVFQVSVGYKFM